MNEITIIYKLTIRIKCYSQLEINVVKQKMLCMYSSQINAIIISYIIIFSAFLENIEVLIITLKTQLNLLAPCNLVVSHTTIDI